MRGLDSRIQVKQKRKEERGRISIYRINSPVVIFIYFFLEGANRDLWLKEDGIIESASAFGYFLCSAIIIYKGKLSYLKKYHYVFILIVFFMLREMDLDKKFTTMGIFKSRFYFTPTVPVMEKIVGGIVILLLFYAVFKIIKIHVKDFIVGLKSHSVVAASIFTVGALLVISKSLDGLARKLLGLGIEISSYASAQASTLEEVLELGIPIILILTFNAYFKHEKV